MSSEVNRAELDVIWDVATDSMPSSYSVICHVVVLKSNPLFSGVVSGQRCCVKPEWQHHSVAFVYDFYHPNILSQESSFMLIEILS